MSINGNKQLYIKILNKKLPYIRIDSIGLHDFKKAKGTKTFKKVPLYTLHYVLSGKGTYQIGNESYSLSKGYFFVTPPQMSLKYFPDEEDPWHYFWFDIDGETREIENLLESLGFHIFDNLIHKSNQGKDILRIIEDLFINTELDLHVSMNTTAAFFKIIDIIYREKLEPLANPGTSDAYIHQIKEYIRLNYHDPDLRVTTILKDIAMSHSHLCKLFRESEKKSIVAYLIDFRLKKASEILISINTSIKEVAEAVGYLDESHFSKEFKKKFGKTPSEYQQSSAEELSDLLMKKIKPEVEK